MSLEIAAKIALVAITMLLLLSVGGAGIMAAPALVPLLWWAARSSGRWARAGLTFLAGLVMTEAGWFVAYIAAGEKQPWITLGPSLGFLGTLALFYWITEPTSGP